MHGKFEVIGLGMSCVDCILKVENNSDLNRGNVLDWSIQGGGKASTAMVAAARLGARTSIMTRVGQDEAGELVISDLKSTGWIRVELLCRRDIALQYYSYW